jgi:hypothetical protein
MSWRTDIRPDIMIMIQCEDQRKVSVAPHARVSDWKNRLSLEGHVRVGDGDDGENLRRRAESKTI